MKKISFCHSIFLAYCLSLLISQPLTAFPPGDEEQDVFMEDGPDFENDFNNEQPPASTDDFTFTPYTPVETVFQSDQVAENSEPHHPLSEVGQAASYPFEEGPFSYQTTQPPPEEEKATDLRQGKGNIKLIKKIDHSSVGQKIDSAETIELLEKQPSEDVSVGAVSERSDASHLVPAFKQLSKLIHKDDLNALSEKEADALAQIQEPGEAAPSEANKPPLPVLTPAEPARPPSPAATPEPAPTTTLPARTTTTRTQTFVTPPSIPVALPPSEKDISAPENRLAPAPTTPTATTKTTTTTTTQIPPPGAPQTLKEISINFNNVAMIEYIRFISRITNKNFIFDDEDLLFNVTIVSEEPTSVENLMAALLQELRIRDLLLIEQGNNVIIHRNPRVRAPGKIIANGPDPLAKETEIVTRVFRLNTLDPAKAGSIIKPLLSDDALVDVLPNTNNLIITDLTANVDKIAQLISSLDAPNSGVTVGQYVVRNTFVSSLVDLATQILQPIAQGNPFVIVPHPSTNSIFVVSNPFIVEKALAILENLDINEGRTKILSLEKLKLQHVDENGRPIGGPGTPGTPGTAGAPGTPGVSPGTPSSLEVPFGPGGAGGSLAIPPAYPNLSPIFSAERVELLPGGISTTPRWAQDLPVGHIERTLFFLYKLKYRRGDQLEIALRRIGESLQMTGLTNIDLVAAINSSQWLEASNSLIFTGTAPALERLKELILEIDVPLHQVFIEMLILDTTITDSLTYGVDWGTRFGGGGTAGGQNFIGTVTGLPDVLEVDNVLTVDDVAASRLSVGGLLRGEGFSLGIIGRHLTHNGTQFSTIAALVRAVHNDSKANIIMNPKIITEDNNTAEIFVGSTDRYKTQSITNDFGTVLTNNFQFIDVGTTLRVTPLIGDNGVITLDIIEEVTNDSGSANLSSAASSVVDVNLVPVLSKSRTVTRVHVPNGFFVVLSGMIRDSESRVREQIPCLGGIPFIGGLAKQKLNRDDKRNLMIFIRPLIVDTEEELENITKRQQDVYIEKSKFRRSWNYEIDEALDLINLKHTDPDDIGCTIR